jgi:ABC-type transport system involved in cytochrome c biogenesis permease component
MTALPILRRELRVAARRPATYWTRGAVALVGLAAATWVFIVTFRDAPKETGIAAFVALTVLGNLYALLAGLRTTADCLSEEKRNGTLGLLFLTDLKSYDVVVGKLAATSVHAFYALLAIFPIMAISLLLGGVTPAEFGRIALVSINNLLFSLAAGMFCSAVGRDDRKTAAATFLGVATLVALPVIGEAINDSTRLNLPLEPFQYPSPGFTCFAAFDLNFQRRGFAQAFWISLGLVHALTWLLLGAACVVVPRTWRDQTSGTSRLAARFQQWQLGTPAHRLARRRLLLEPNPFTWLAYRERFKQSAVYLMLAGLGFFWGCGYVRVGSAWLEDAAIPFALAAHSILKVWLANESTRRFCEDRRSGALEILLASPLTVSEIIRGQLQALGRQFIGPAALVLAADLLLMGGGLTRITQDRSSWVLVWLAGMAMLAWDLHALSWVGPWMALNRRSPTRAASAALMRICVLPWALFAIGIAFFILMVSFLHFYFRPWTHGPGPFVLAWGAWLALGGAVNLLFTWWAQFRLKTGFREAATRPFEAAPSYGDWGRALARFLR